MSQESFSTPNWKQDVESLPPDALRNLPPEERNRVIWETARELMGGLERAGATPYADVNEMYRALGQSELIVRRAGPERLIEAIANNEPIEIRTKGDEAYANSAIWHTSSASPGLANAYLEGYGEKNSVVAVFGFDPKEAAVAVEKLPDDRPVSPGMNREQVRFVHGTIEPRHVRFVSLRIPIEGFPESQMTEDEKDELFESQQPQQDGTPKRAAFIHRGFLFSKKQ